MILNYARISNPDDFETRQCLIVYRTILYLCRSVVRGMACKDVDAFLCSALVRTAHV